MKIIIDSTDKRHLGETIDETQDPIVFRDGEAMPVEFRLHGGTVLGNSNYIIVIAEKE